MTCNLSKIPATIDSPRVGPRQLLQEIHRKWLEEAGELLESARSPEAGIYCRWSALKYLTTSIFHRFEVERGMVESLGQRIPPADAAQLWLTAELMVALGWQVDHAIGLCHRTDDFGTLTRSVEQAFAHWCRAVEAAFGGLSWGKLPEESRRRFLFLGFEGGLV